ncbi:hypothetical protein RlegWSM1455_07155 [Rhizobium laguerreae]|uniref:hypothetical protein n=1 Tax=Rhizobium laguerreae TaxID=1076926 RepID=UPI001E37E73A|nr:hypothetical protein [Rhizobium laguerreae]UFW65792.1 hypothetical protein RlegWSM1455_07155 [Rhizobium laguerreae]
MTELFNDYGMVEIVDDDSLTDGFKRVRFLDSQLAYIECRDGGYLVFSDTMRYRMDDEPHPLDVKASNEKGQQAHVGDVEAYLRSLD